MLAAKSLSDMISSGFEVWHVYDILCELNTLPASQRYQRGKRKIFMLH